MTRCGSVLEIASLPESALEAAAQFHNEYLPRAAKMLRDGVDPLTILFPAADHTHRGWRLALVQGLAREYAPSRVNAIAGGGAEAQAMALQYLGLADGVTGQYLLLDDAGAGDVIPFLR